MSSLIRIIKIKNIKYKGFSMVEAVIAIAVLTVILTPTFDFIITLISISKNLQNRAEMVNISYEGLEFMINLRENIKKECNTNYYSGITVSGINIDIKDICKDNAASSDQISSGLGFQIFSNMILPKDNNPGCNASTTATIQLNTNLCQIDINKFNSTSTIWNIINNDNNDIINNTNTNTPAPISATNASNTTAYYNTNDSSNNFSNLLKLYKQSSGSVDYNSTASGASSTQYARLIWAEKESDFVSNSSGGTDSGNIPSAIKIYSLVCIVPTDPNTPDNKNPCNPLVTSPDLSKRIILSTSIYR